MRNLTKIALFFPFAVGFAVGFMSIFTSETACGDDLAEKVQARCEKLLTEGVETWNQNVRDMLVASDGVEWEVDGSYFLLKNAEKQHELAKSFEFRPHSISLVSKDQTLGLAPGVGIIGDSGNTILFFYATKNNLDSTRENSGILIFSRPEHGDKIVCEGNFSQKFSEKVTQNFQDLEKLQKIEKTEEDEETISETENVKLEKLPEDWNLRLREISRTGSATLIYAYMNGNAEEETAKNQTCSLQITLPVSDEIREKLTNSIQFEFENMDTELLPSTYLAVQYLGTESFIIMPVDGIVVHYNSDFTPKYFRVSGTEAFTKILWQEVNAILETF
ncbi:MAG: hypothetical protein Q4C70_03415 [Planctomycetia bacterium]|nr:hypothetical protein [Planctomycetia bacterium]